MVPSNVTRNILCFSEERYDGTGEPKGELKLSLEYWEDVLLVMVHRAKDLAMPEGSTEAPNSYVKVSVSFKLLKTRS